jgi:FAD/FMN-containing dehydrogenase
MEALLEALRAVVGSDGVRTDPADLEPHVIDWRRRYRGTTAAVVLPRSTVEVAAVVQACVRERVAIIPQGGNTGMSGAAVPLAQQGRNLIVNLARMNRIRAIDRDNSTMTVDAGCVLRTIQEQAEAAGRHFPLSLGAEGSCQIGGNLSTNAGGTAVLRYGNARELVLGLEVVLPDGSIWESLRGLRKDNTGYDLKALFMGAEGTLGLITAAVLKLFAPPRERATAWAAVPRLQDAVTLLTLCRDTLDQRLSAFEYLSRGELDLVLRHVKGTTDPLPGAAAGYVLLELSDSMVTGQLAGLLESVLGQAVDRGLVSDAAIASSGPQAQSFWKIRHSVTEANLAHGVSLNHDVAVPTSRLADFVEGTTEQVRMRFPQAEVVTVTHLGDGNVHYLVIFPRPYWESLADPAEHAAQVRRLVFDRAVESGGSFSAEHGIGQSLTGELGRYRSPVELGLMQRLKSSLDPLGLMNPGKVLGLPGA